MPDPHTLLLHETKHPDRPLLFTLDGDTFSLDLSAIFVPEAPQPGAPPPDPLEARLLPYVQKMAQSFLQPAHVRDVLFLVNEDQVIIQVWKRTRGLRLAPATIGLSAIDDPQAAADFAAQIKERASAAAHPGKYAGALDYWGTWIFFGAAVVGAFTSLGYWLSRRCGAPRDA